MKFVVLGEIENKYVVSVLAYRGAQEKNARVPLAS